MVLDYYKNRIFFSAPLSLGTPRIVNARPGDCRPALPLGWVYIENGRPSDREGGLLSIPRAALRKRKRSRKSNLYNHRPVSPTSRVETAPTVQAM